MEKRRLFSGRKNKGHAGRLVVTSRSRAHGSFMPRGGAAAAFGSQVRSANIKIEKKNPLRGSLHSRVRGAWCSCVHVYLPNVCACASCGGTCVYMRVKTRLNVITQPELRL